ncbi:MAG: bifunctional anthranilate synthase component II/anthranilate phosphoribosyltransferase, partial [Spirochaetes bacterium]|nr:bifunctional anthranilate synthase component II/anthranilate phosphoribosyltransferase [Spirochaetota bacterium]
MILLVDNYDSFTYNVYQALLGLGREVKVVRNDTVTVEQVREMDPEAIIISPGPGRPEDSGCSMALIGEFSGHIPILGICLGHQCIGQVFGGTVIPARELFHGKES